jgi:signal transduction histidine kinase/CheY-like chemotaxis protein
LRLKSQKIIKKSEATISALIENAAGLIWSIDSHYNYIAFNNAFKTLNKSLAKDDLKIGDPTTKILFSPELTQQLSEAYQKVFKGENVNFKAEITLNQKTKYYSFSLSPIKVEYTKTIGVTVFGTDLTSERNQEIALIKAKEYAEELTKSKQHFLSNMSHEIRTPLNGIIGFTSILLKNETLSEEQQKYLQAIKNSGDILLVIINDILDLSKMEAGKMTFESIPISLPNIVEEAIETFVLKSEEKNIQILKNIEIDAAFDFIGDPVRIAQVLLNILSNAIKFTPQNGTITIQSKILSSTEEESIFQISIEDSGIGIEQEKLDLIFQPFVQTNEDTTRKFGGTGLGLSIVQKIIELMNGSIKVTSIIGKGSTFIIEIPLKRQTNAKEKLKTEVYQEQQSTFTPSDVRILLAEDNVINQLLAQAVIGQYGFQLTTVENGALAADLLESEHFDLILMDLMMPVMDGYEATRNIRQMANEVKKKVPIIALTADVTTMNAEKCKDFGMDDYLSKPFDSKTLYDKIAFLLNKT